MYFRLDIILVKGTSKHTLNTYFMKKILTKEQDRLLIKVTPPVLIGQQTLPKIHSLITCPQDRLRKPALPKMMSQ